MAKKSRKHQHRQQKTTTKQAITNVNIFKGRYSDKEREIIRSFFKSENEQLIMAVHKFLLQGDMSDGEVTIIKSLPKEAIDVFRRTVIPEMNPEDNFGQVTDMWVSIDTADRDPLIVFDCMRSRKIVIDYFNKRFDILCGGAESKKDIQLKDLVYDGKKNERDSVVDMSARNTILKHINMHLTQLIVMADQTPESQEELEKRRAKDSAK